LRKKTKLRIALRQTVGFLTGEVRRGFLQAL